MWLIDPTLADNIQHWWLEGSQFFGTRMFIFTPKLNFLKSKLKQWNVNSFGNISNSKHSLEQELELIESRLQSERDDSLLEQERFLIKKLDEVHL